MMTATSHRTRSSSSNSSSSSSSGSSSGNSKKKSYSWATCATAAATLLLAARPSLAIEEVDCGKETTVRWSASSDRLYLEDGGCITLSEIVEDRGDKGPLYHFNKEDNEIVDEYTGTFFLNSSMYIEDNTLLNIVSPAYGGDASRLLLTSDADKYINLRAHGGRLMVKGAKIRSLDRSANDGIGGADKDVTDGRSYISAVSEVVGDNLETCSGAAKENMGEARMDIIDSQITQLGYNGAESYGVSYKVRGLCDDLSNLEVMDQVGVWGDINGTMLAYNYFGHYSFGHQGGHLDANEVHHNQCYGINPHDDSDYMTITDNEIHHNGCHGIFAADRCNDLLIDGNEVYSNDDVGVLLHRSSDHCTVSNNDIYKNDDAGIALFETSDTKVYGNNVERNTYGMRWSVGSSTNEVYDNTFDVFRAENPLFALHMYQGSNTPEVEGSDGRIRNNHIHDNFIRSPIEALKISGTDGNTFTDNTIQGEYSRFYDVENDLFADNTWFTFHAEATEGNEAELDFVADETELTDDTKHGILVKDSCFDQSSSSEFPFCETL